MTDYSAQIKKEKSLIIVAIGTVMAQNYLTIDDILNSTEATQKLIVRKLISEGFELGYATRLIRDDKIQNLIFAEVEPNLFEEYDPQNNYCLSAYGFRKHVDMSGRYVALEIAGKYNFLLSSMTGDDDFGFPTEDVSKFSMTVHIENEDETLIHDIVFTADNFDAYLKMVFKFIIEYTITER